MILHDLCGDEDHPVYQDFEAANGNRQYHFLQSIVGASLSVARPFLSRSILEALNFHAIACLHSHAGEYRPCVVYVRGADGQVAYQPPEPFRVGGLMDDLINMVNRVWETTDELVLAAYVLWRLNHIHPFINGNGRTARAACYFVICVKAGGWLPGKAILPELLRANRDEYIEALKKVDQSAGANLEPLRALLEAMLKQQLASANGGDQAQVAAPAA